MTEKIASDFVWYYNNGYITSRDGNAAYRDNDVYVVTASGKVKNNLDPLFDFTLVDKDLKVLDACPFKPSIEASAHIQLLEQSKKNCSVHVHSPNTVALATLFDKVKYKFGPSTNVLVSVLNNDWPELFRYTKVGNVVPFLAPGSKELHNAILDCLLFSLSEKGPSYSDIIILQRHGVFAIGNSMEECREHIVRLEHISTILLKIISASGNIASIL